MDQFVRTINNNRSEAGQLVKDESMKHVVEEQGHVCLLGIRHMVHVYDWSYVLLPRVMIRSYLYFEFLVCPAIHVDFLISLISLLFNLIIFVFYPKKNLIRFVHPSFFLPGIHPSYFTLYSKLYWVKVDFYGFYSMLSHYLLITIDTYK